MIGIKKLLKNKKVILWGGIILLVYFGLYLWSINHLNFGSYHSNLKTVWLTNWKTLMFKRISPFLFEPIGYIEVFKSVRLLIAPVNLIIGLLLSVLVFINVGAVVYMYSLPKQCRINTKFSGLIGILPSFLTGFACCAPSFLLPFASILGSTTAFLSKIFIWFLPISILILIYGAIKSIKRINTI